MICLAIRQQSQALTVVGVVENELQGGNLGAPYEPMVYMDYLQLPKDSFLSEVFSMMAEFAVRSTLPQAVLEKELRAAIKQVAPDMAEMQIQPMEEGIAQSLRDRRLALRLVASFGGMALILSAIGIYGVLAYSVVMRRREIGIRMALGCSRGGATRLVIRQAGAMVLLGMLPGIMAAWAAGHAVKSFLFGVRTIDPPTLGVVTVLLLLVGTLAAGIPALRAAQVDPMEAIRIE
jgi:putative ABC transport system permease protein